MDFPEGVFFKVHKLLITLQFPIADSRPFIPRLNLRLPVPDWPDPSTSFLPQFIHHFGQAKERNRDPDQAWPDEIKFCHARRGLRFDQLERHPVRLNGKRLRVRCAFRRLFCDGLAVVRMEVGIVVKRAGSNPLTPMTINETLSVVHQICECPTIVANPVGRPSCKPIIAQGKFLARLFAYASMNPIDGESLRTGLQLVESADPLILLESGKNELAQDTIQSPSKKGIREVPRECVNGAEALFCRLNTGFGIVSTWSLQRGSAKNAQLRSLRICLTRLHAEREVLDLILKQIQRKRLLNPSTEEAIELLDTYFNDHTKIINRNKWAGMNQSEILAAFDATQSVLRKASHDQLVSRYEGSHRQVWKKVQKFQEQRRATRIVHSVTIKEGDIHVDKHINVSGTGNIINVAEYMSNVTNTVNNNLAQSNADAEIQDLIAELNRQVEIVAPNADPGQIKKMGKNLERLSEEVASEEPEKRWYEVSLDGLKEATEAVGEIAGPILKIVGKLSTLLL